jgi:hypothetical protein
MCGEAYQFKYVQGLPSPGSGSMTRGSAVHKGIEAALRKKMKGDPVLVVVEACEIVGQEFDARSAEVLDWGKTTAEACKTEAVQLYEAFHVGGLNRFNPTAVEKGFAVNFGGVPLVGFIDALDEQPAITVAGMDPELAKLAPKKKVVVDFKTSATKWSDNDVRTDTQLTLYAAVERTPYIRIDQLIPYKRGAQYVRAESERTAEDIAILEDDVGEVAQRIRQGIFPKADIGAWNCGPTKCPYWSMCRGKIAVNNQKGVAIEP